MSGIRRLLAASATVGLLTSCGGVDRISTRAAPELPAESRAGEPIPVAAATRTATLAQSVMLQQAAVWPAADVVFDTPEGVAADFVQGLFGTPRELSLSEFRAGDARSGEIDVVFSSPDVTSPQVTSTLLLRQLGPEDGWFVLAGVSDSVSITAPESGATIAPDQVVVQGVGTGFESTIHVSAFPAGDADNTLDETFTSGGVFGPEPYSATLDLTAAPAGFTAIMAAGDSGVSVLAQEFTVIPVVVGLPGTR